MPSSLLGGMARVELRPPAGACTTPRSQVIYFPLPLSFPPLVLGSSGRANARAHWACVRGIFLYLYVPAPTSQICVSPSRITKVCELSPIFFIHDLPAHSQPCTARKRNHRLKRRRRKRRRRRMHGMIEKQAETLRVLQMCA